jgi:hypothetical protein
VYYRSVCVLSVCVRACVCCVCACVCPVCYMCIVCVLSDEPPVVPLEGNPDLKPAMTVIVTVIVTVRLLHESACVYVTYTPQAVWKRQSSCIIG